MIFNIYLLLCGKINHCNHWDQTDRRMLVWQFVSLSVCQFVCLFVSTITSERLNVGWWNLADTCILQKSRRSSNVKVKGQRSRSSGTKKGKSAAKLPYLWVLSM